MIAGPKHFVNTLPLRVTAIPIASVVAGSATSLWPIIVTEPLLPPFGLMMLLAWRLLRPEIWAAWIALPLGLADDLLSGHDLGIAMALWTIVLLALDWIDHHFVWRDWWMEWGIAIVAITIVQALVWLIAQPLHGHAPIVTLSPQLVGAFLLFPAILRLTAALDRWRLKR